MEVLGKAEAALDGFVGPAMNIQNDDTNRSVARQGDELALKVRKSDRYTNRGVVNQSAYNNALSDSLPLLDEAFLRTSDEPGRAIIREARDSVRRLAGDSRVEDQISSVSSALQDDAKVRLKAVSADAEGRDVSEHGRPIWDLFESGMTSLSDTQSLANREKTQLQAIISDLQSIV